VTKDHLTRLEKLEAARSAKSERFDSIDILYRKKDPAMKRALAEGERWVEDWHVDPDGHIREIRMRITADASECGRNYLRGETGSEAEDQRLERKTSRAGIISVVTKAGETPFSKGRTGNTGLKYS
jgi:hypothetical protein